MLFHEVRIWTHAGLAALLGVICCSLAYPACEIRTQRVASSFLSTEAVQFSVTSDLPSQRLAWSVTDYYGEQRANSVIQAGEGSTNLTVTPHPGVGYYTLSLQYESGAECEKVFCVLPHPDDARGDGGLFGIGGAPPHEWFWDAAWQMGARHCRAEFAWTEVERVQGEYRLDWVRKVAELARKRDMQLTVLTGHTPRHYSVRPIDSEKGQHVAYYSWQPERTIEWYRYIDAMGSTLMPQRLAATPGHPADTLPRAQRRLVRAWEVWSEADQSFYYGSWNRYLDMLRIAYSTLKQKGRVPVVYGSCGHMTEMKYTIQAGCSDYFDRMAYHPYGKDPEWELMHWYRNMPQALVYTGGMRDTALTECGLHPQNGATEEGFMPRTYATLKAFGEDLFIRAQCLGAVFPGRENPRALAVRKGDDLEPRPAYVAFAVTRWLLESAHYVGPLDAPGAARMHLFLRGGSPMVIGWTTEGTREVEVEVSPRARMMDAMGKVTPLAGPTATVELTPNAVALLDVAFTEFTRAARAGLELSLATEMGHESETPSRWVDDLEDDIAACTGADGAQAIRDSVHDACESFLRDAPGGPAEFFEAQRVVGDVMLQVADAAREQGSLEALHSNTIWRLTRLAERLGGIADGLGERWPRMHNVSPADLQKTLTSIESTRTRVRTLTRGARCPFADRLMERALDQLDSVRRGGGHARGAWWAATVTARAAHSLTAVETPKMLDVFVTANFTSADIIAKGILLRPTSNHTLDARVYNFLSEDISGRLGAEMPDDWGAKAPPGTFQAPARGVSELSEVSFSVPERPRPWVQRDLHWFNIKVDAPPTADVHQQVVLAGEMTLGQIEPMVYRVFVGAYPSTHAPAAGDMIVIDDPITPRGADDMRSLLGVLRPAWEPATIGRL